MPVAANNHEFSQLRLSLYIESCDASHDIDFCDRHTHNIIISAAFPVRQLFALLFDVIPV